MSTIDPNTIIHHPKDKGFVSSIKKNFLRLFGFIYKKLGIKSFDITILILITFFLIIMLWLIAPYLKYVFNDLKKLKWKWNFLKRRKRGGGKFFSTKNEDDGCGSSDEDDGYDSDNSTLTMLK